MKTGLRPLVFLVLLTALVTNVADAQDDPIALADEGRSALKAGDNQKALELFQQVVQSLQAMLAESLEQFIPAARKGWSAGEIRSNSWTGTTEQTISNMTNLSCEYKRESDGARLTVSLTNWPHLVTGMRQSLTMYKQMPQVMTADPNRQITVEDSGDWTILRIHDKKRESADVHAVHEHAMFTIDLDRGEMGVADDYLGSVNLSDLGNALAQ